LSKIGSVQETEDDDKDDEEKADKRWDDFIDVNDLVLSIEVVTL
jgi:hypothetical protein